MEYNYQSPWFVEALQKEDKTWTYFAGDLAYHSNKIERNYEY